MKRAFVLIVNMCIKHSHTPLLQWRRGLPPTIAAPSCLKRFTRCERPQTVDVAQLLTATA